MRYKSHLLFGTENASVSVSLPTFSSDKRKSDRRHGENTVNRSQAASTSEDELKTKQTHQSKFTEFPCSACGIRLQKIMLKLPQ
ncbi:hypothetical protein [Psychromonas sp. SR45-3]|uniref:hypothetical protein n=1 Tax=Psychromonas sp. SR45-3 TaxID=2760930 RepID=UPI0015F9FA6B|nr:hypothetical protein [Psychromonas sp. SR45-3]MBB1274129.1 hypothetical protein [Psychromonas sp. SR45-3]